LAGDSRGDANGAAVTAPTDTADREAEARAPSKHRELPDAESSSEAEQEHGAASKEGSSKPQRSEAQSRGGSVRGECGERLGQVEAGETRVEGGASVVRVGAVVMLDPSLLPGHAHNCCSATP